MLNLINPLSSRRLAIALCLLIFSSIGTPAFAKDYVVNLIIFEHLASRPRAPVINDVTTINANIQDQGELFYPISRNPVLLDSPAAIDAGFFRVNSNEQMQLLEKKIKASRGYKVLSHLSWQQPGLATQLARPIQITYGDAFSLYIEQQAIAQNGLIKGFLQLPVPPAASLPELSQDQTVEDPTDPASTMLPAPMPLPEMEKIESHQLAGSVTISLGKYLHIDTNLVLTDIAQGKSHKMKSHRRMRSKQLNHLDNPRFGLIILIIPVETANE